MQTTWNLQEARTTFMRQMADRARGELLRQLRKQRGKSQEQVAHEIGVSAKSYGSWEGGGGIHLSNAKKVARYYKVKPGEIVTPEFPFDNPPDQTELSEDDRERLRRIEKQLDEILKRLPPVEPAEDTEEGDELDETLPDEQDEAQAD